MTNTKSKKSNTLIYILIGVVVGAFLLVFAANRSSETGLRGIEESSRRWGELNQRIYHPELTDPDAGDRGDGEARR